MCIFINIGTRVYWFGKREVLALARVSLSPSVSVYVFVSANSAVTSLSFFLLSPSLSLSLGFSHAPIPPSPCLVSSFDHARFPATYLSRSSCPFPSAHSRSLDFLCMCESVRSRARPRGLGVLCESVYYTVALRPSYRRSSVSVCTTRTERESEALTHGVVLAASNRRLDAHQAHAIHCSLPIVFLFILLFLFLFFNSFGFFVVFIIIIFFFANSAHPDFWRRLRVGVTSSFGDGDSIVLIYLCTVTVQ